MKAKQSTRRQGVTLWLSGCALVALAAVALHLGAWPSPVDRLRTTSQPETTAQLHLASANAAAVSTGASTGDPASRQRVLNAYGHLPLVFEANQGQTDAQVKYLARGSGYTLFLTSSQAVLSVRSGTSSPAKDAMLRRRMGLAKWQKSAPPAATQTAVLRMQMVGANPQAEVAGQNLLPGVTNYYIGNEPSKWRAGVPQYGRVGYHGVYPGVDLAFHGEQRQLEFDFVLAPGADPARIGLQFTGAKHISLDDSGNLVLASAAGDVTMKKPVAYQESNGTRHAVESRFVVKDRGQVGVALGDYDRSRQVVIDPSVSFAYSTYLGGSGEDEALGIAVDGSGNAYITGDTNSPGTGTTDFPGAGPTAGGKFDAFVTKLNSTGTAITYTTLVGGLLGDSFGDAIAVDAAGDAFVAGTTDASDFPHPNAADPTINLGKGTMCASGTRACFDGFVLKLDTTGTLPPLYSTFLGGSNDDFALGIAIDTLGNAYVAGDTFSADFPGTASGTFNKGAGANGNDDGFVAKISPAGSSLVWATYLGGTGPDQAFAIALKPGCASSCASYVTGLTGSTDFPTTTGAFQTICGTDGTCNASGGTPQSDGFVTAVSPLGAVPSGASAAGSYSTYLGGSGSDIGTGIAVDSSGDAFVTGATNSPDFPIPAGVPSFQPTLYDAGSGAFVTGVKPAGTGVLYSSFLGGSNQDESDAIAVDSHGNAYVTGTTLSIDFPTADALQPALNGTSDAFVTEVDAKGATKIYSTYLGGSGDENSEGALIFGTIAVDSSNKAYVAGVTTSSSGFPTTAGAPQSTFGGGTCTIVGTSGPCPDAFVAQLAAAPGSASADFSVGVEPSGIAVASGTTASGLSVSVTALHGFVSPPPVTLSCAGLPAHAACTFGSTSISSFPGSTTLTIATNAASAQLAPFGNSRSGIFYAAFLPLGGLALLGAGFPKRRRKLLWLLLGCCVLAGLMILPACGSGSGGGGGGGGNTTPPGSYTINVVGTANGVVHQAGLLLQVH